MENKKKKENKNLNTLKLTLEIIGGSFLALEYILKCFDINLTVVGDIVYLFVNFFSSKFHGNIAFTLIFILQIIIIIVIICRTVGNVIMDKAYIKEIGTIEYEIIVELIMYLILTSFAVATIYLNSMSLFNIVFSCIVVIAGVSFCIADFKLRKYALYLKVDEEDGSFSFDGEKPYSFPLQVIIWVVFFAFNLIVFVFLKLNLSENLQLLIILITLVLFFVTCFNLKNDNFKFNSEKYKIFDIISLYSMVASITFFVVFYWNTFSFISNK